MPQHGDTLSNISREVTRELLERDASSYPRSSVNYHLPHKEMSDRSQHTDKHLQLAERRQRHRSVQSSGTYTTLSKEACSEQDEIDDREIFVIEYNRLAKKYGVRLLNPSDNDIDACSVLVKPGSWFSRMLRRTSSTHSTKPKIERRLSHKRSISDISLRGSLKAKHSLKAKSLQDLVRLCGLSLFYLPADFAPCNLAVPTCFRATAQYLVQHGPAVPGVFRIPGSNNVVAALYDHYCPRGEEEDIASTVRSPTLPQHIEYDVHDVASTFKRFLSGVPGGILGSLALFNTLVSIQNQFHADPELPAKKRHQIRSRLIALAIATQKSQYRRELICAVFGLLSMIGQAAESECHDGQGESLPVSDLMGYGPLGIVFGPLLIGELLDDYNLRLPNPYSGLIVLPVSPPKSRKERQKERPKSSKSFPDSVSLTTHVDKIKVVNSITEMLIVHWQEVVSFMKISQALNAARKNRELTIDAPRRPLLRLSASEVFPRDLRDYEPGGPFASNSRDGSLANENATFSPRRMRSKSQPLFRKSLSVVRSKVTLTQTMEEQASEVAIEPASSKTSNEVKLSDTSLEEKPLCTPNAETSAESSIQPSSEGAATRNHNLGPKLHRSERRQDRILRLPQKKTTRSLTTHYDAEIEDHSSSAEPLSSAITSGGATPQAFEPHEWFRNVASEPGFWLSDPGILSAGPGRRSSPSTISDSSRLRARTFVAVAAGDPLSNVSPQEDLASLAELARVMSQDSETNLLVSSVRQNRHDKDMWGTEAISRNSILGRNGSHGSSSSSVLNLASARRPTVSRGHETSGSSSSPLSIFLSKRRRGAGKQRHSNMAPVGLVESGTAIFEVPKPSLREQRSTDKYTNRFSLFGPIKSTAERHEIDSPVRASPRGTVKALVAKFSLGTAPLPLACPASRPRVPAVRVDHGLRKSSIVSPYTKNAPSIRSQRSGISDKTVKEAQSPPKLDLCFKSPKKNYPSAAPAPNKQPRSCVSINSPSPMARKSLVGISSPSEDSLGRASRQKGPLGYEVGACSSVNSSKTVRRAFIMQPNVSNTDISYSNSVSVATPKTPMKSSTSERSNSELQGQIQALQQQLAAKTEEVQQLRNELDIRTAQDRDALAENMVEARKEIQFWKSRAELYEKQVDMMRQTSSRASSKHTANQQAKTGSQSGASAMNRNEDIDDVVHRGRRDLHALDGASSWYSQSSEKGGSAGALYGFQDAGSSSENGSWLEQTMSALGRTES